MRQKHDQRLETRPTVVSPRHLGLATVVSHLITHIPETDNYGMHTKAKHLFHDGSGSAWVAGHWWSGSEQKQALSKSCLAHMSLVLAAVLVLYCNPRSAI